LWQDQASCKRSNPEEFFPTSAPDPQTKQRCARCPVREQCLAFALENNMVGVWGGTSTKERRRLKAELRRGSAA